MTQSAKTLESLNMQYLNLTFLPFQAKREREKTDRTPKSVANHVSEELYESRWKQSQDRTYKWGKIKLSPTQDNR